MPSVSAGQRSFSRFATVLLGYLLLVIVFGAWVRITGSGAGCGDHWPTCQGVVLPRSPSQATLIEYTHRITSGLLGMLTLLLPLWAFRSFPRGHAARRWSVYTLLLTGVEAAIGAGLVKAQLVADDASVARAVVVALHLVNTLLLTACAALTVASSGQPEQAPAPPAPVSARVSSQAGWWLGGLLVALALVAATGAVTALGDTLFPVGERGSAQSEPSHFLVQLRAVHPILAIAVVFASMKLAKHLFLRSAPRSGERRWSLALALLSIAQFGVGLINIWLRAPGWLQLTHLLVAQLLWISAVLLTRAVASEQRSELAAALEPQPS